MSSHEPVAAERACAAALVFGALAGVVAMAFHPSGRDLLAVDGRAAAVLRDQLVHGAAIAAIAAQTFGALGLVRRLRAATLGAAEFGFVAQALASFAVVVAACASGFIAPRLVAGLDATDPVLRAAADAAWHYNGAVNQAFAKVYVFAGSAAIGLWSLAGWRRGLPRWLPRFGVAIAAALPLLLAVGHLRLDVHGFIVVVLAQAVWMVGAGFALRR